METLILGQQNQVNPMIHATNRLTTITQSIALGATLLFLTSCATLFSSGPDPISFSSEPDGASVIVNGVPMGETPVVLELESNKETTVTFRRDGYKDVTVALTTHVQPGWVVLDILGGIIGVAVDAATGEWKAFDSGEQYVTLEPVAGN